MTIYQNRLPTLGLFYALEVRQVKTFHQLLYAAFVFIVFSPIACASDGAPVVGIFENEHFR